MTKNILRRRSVTASNRSGARLRGTQTGGSLLFSCLALKNEPLFGRLHLGYRARYLIRPRRIARPVPGKPNKRLFQPAGAYIRTCSNC